VAARPRPRFKVAMVAITRLALALITLAFAGVAGVGATPLRDGGEEVGENVRAFGLRLRRTGEGDRLRDDGGVLLMLLVVVVRVLVTRGGDADRSPPL